MKRGGGEECGGEGGASEISQDGVSEQCRAASLWWVEGPFKKGLSDAPPDICARLTQSLFSSLRKSATLSRALSEN